MPKFILLAERKTRAPRITTLLLLFSTVMLLVTSVMIVSARAEFIPAQYDAVRASVPPTIDGRIDDTVWLAAAPIEQFFVFKSGGAPASSTGRMQLLWDDTHLYVGMQLQDSTLLPSSVTTGAAGKDAPLYEGDVIELFIRQSANSNQYHEFEWNAAGDYLDARFDRVRFGSPSTTWDSNQQSAVTVAGTIGNAADVDEGWTVEAAIPLSGFEPVDVGSEWFFSFARYDYFKVGPDSTSANLMMTTRGDPTAAMGGVTNGFHTYEIYDVLRFVEGVDGRGDFDTNGVLDAQDLMLLATAIRDADLSFDLNGDATTDSSDYLHWVQAVRRTWVGDSNLDGMFGTADLVLAFQAGKFETSAMAAWQEGDWNGDQVFDSSDIVSAFSDGGFEQGTRPAIAVPEFHCHVFASLAAAGLLFARRLVN